MDARRPLTVADLARRIRAAEPRLGPTRLVCIDGPAGSGKTTLAERLAEALRPEAALVHLEDLYAGWTLTGAVARLCAGVLRPLAEARAGAHSRYDWQAGRFATRATSIPPAAVLIVEGCGSSPRLLDPWTTLRIWVEAPEPLRTQRGLARDGAHLAAQWRRWQQLEAADFAAQDTRARADVRLDGRAALADGTSPPVP